MATLEELRRKIESRQAVLGVIGLGYVGLPVACKFAGAGFRVVGVDVRAERAAWIEAGRSPVDGNEPGLAELLARVRDSGRLRATTDYGELRQADVVLIAVETPVDDDHIPRYAALRSACESLALVLREGALVIVESTVSPGTTDRLVKPWLEAAAGRALSRGFYLGHCPERVMPGKLLDNLENVSRVCGGGTPETAETMVVLYRTIVRADLDRADCLTAELVKTAENAYRDVNIAFANEVALICEAVGGDVWRVRELVNKSPGRNMLLPGAGVGGHCIPKDPWLLAHGADGKAPLRLIPAARAVNDSMPLHVAGLLGECLRAHGRDLAGSRILVLGYAYLEDSDDVRNSPSRVLVEHLRELGAEVMVHDPYVPGYQVEILQAARGCHVAIVMVRHRAYRELDLSGLKAALQLPILVDGRNTFDPATAEAVGFTYRRLGQ
jgi:UDP-N-acetyl-D-mannosaminuronic acid dehydrogenase